MEPRDNSASRSEFAFVLSLSLSLNFFPIYFGWKRMEKGRAREKEGKFERERIRNSSTRSRSVKSGCHFSPSVAVFNFG